MSVMKKILFLVAAATLLLTAACSKEKNCRCAVLGTQTVRIITISSGDCRKITYARYHDVLDTLHVDTLVCTDYPFEADSIVVYND